MPQVEPTVVSQEEAQKQTETQESLQNNVLDKIKSGNVFKNLAEDLPSQEIDAPAQEAENTDRPEPRGNAKPIQDEESEQTQEPEQQEESQEDEEEVVPKSKIQPRIDQLTARLKAQEAEIAQLRQKSSEPVDDIQRQLDSMNEDTLEDTLTQVRVAKEKARDDDAKLLELVKLERRIEKQIAVAPQKFVQSQVSEANKTIDRLVSEGSVTNENYSEILKIAKDIYQRYPKMQKALDGQAMAVELAVEHSKALGKVNSVAANTQNLKGQINNLKKKTALDTKAVKSGGEKVNLDRLRSNAMTGSMKDKERFAQNDSRFKIDAMIPDFLKG